MSQENVERVLEAFEGFNRGEVEAVVAVCDPAVEWLPPTEVPDFAPLHGHAGVRKAAADMFEAFGQLRAEPEEAIDRDNHVVVLFRWSGLGKGSDVPLSFGDADQAAVFTMRDGKAVRVAWFTSRREALEVAGLQE